jgi:FixJ family two-component response regulator
MNLQYTCVVHKSNRLQSEAPIVFIVDSDSAMRTTLESTIRSAGLQASTISSAEEFLARPRATTPSCLLLELALPGMSGLELQELIVERTELPIIFMSERPDLRATVQAMKAGAFEVLMKPLASDTLLSAIELAIERSRAELHQLERTRALQRRYESLSRREREVLDLVVSGRLNKQVGGELGISEITVKAHRGKLMRKMQARSFAELVNMAASLGRAPPARAPDVDLPHAFLHADTLRAVEAYRHA